MAELATYRAKRDFSKTAEPSGQDAVGPGGDRFVIQKHAARRLHYDLRLELDGVLKSWAVTRGPSLVPGDKRLAVETEDHPLDYGDFEGTIPQGEYGGGTVVVWDNGTWTPEGDPHRGFAKGHLEFELHGHKLRGRWHLVRLKGRRGEKRVNWLLIKSDDAEARRGSDPDILEEAPLSVKTGRSVEEVARGAPPAKRSKAASTSAKLPATRKAKAAPSAPRRASTKAEPAGAAPRTGPDTPVDLDRIGGARPGALPDFVEPCLATLQAKAPVGASWLHEIKFDGYRLQARIEDGSVRLLTRNGHDWTDRFGPAVVGALARLPVRAALVDGELVVERANGASDFSALQADLAEGRTERFVYYAFDLLYLDGLDLRPAQLIERKEALAALLAELDPAGALRYSAHFDEDGDRLLRHACRLALEGIVSKRADRPYRSGRGKDWIKSKCADRQEFVIAGWVPSTVSPKRVGSLVLGYHEGGELVHAGRVGTGFSTAIAADLARRLEAIRADKAPFPRRLPAAESRGVVWVRPDLVAEVEFRGWTAAQSLRHASFRGLREDKAAAEVVRESGPTEVAAPEAPPLRSSVTLTHPDRVYWPEVGITKQGLADYYAQVWRWIAPEIVGRPLSLLRCPDGVPATCFFQKHAWRGIHKAIRQYDDPDDSSEKPILWIEDFDGLIALVQAGVLEIHPWGSTLAEIDRPDRLIIDLDPHEGVGWDRMIEAALDTKARLEAVGLVPFLKTTGGKGLHVVAPMKPSADWATLKAFTRNLAETMEREMPDHYVSTASKAKRTGRIFVDYLRNGRGATAVAAYSTRARAGAPVSMPVEWDDLGPDLRSNGFGVSDAAARIAARPRDPWENFAEAAVPLPVTAGSGSARGRRRAP